MSVALVLSEREEIRAGLERHESFAQIGERLGRDRSTVSREVTRNGGREAYSACAAETRACQQRRRPKVAKLRADRELAAIVSEDLKRGFSPAAIAVRLRNRGGPTVCHETIYTALYALPRFSWLTVRPKQCLRSHRCSRRRRRTPGEPRRRPVGLGSFRSVHDRPSGAAQRSELGHWEGDLIVGWGGRTAIVTLVERVTRFTVLGHLAHQDRRSDEVLASLVTVFESMPAGLARTLTWDRGKEMCPWLQLEERTPVKVFFCDARSPWQRPTNENTNRQLRYWLPKKTDLSTHSPEHLAGIAEVLNDHPRRLLQWHTPAELYADACRALTA